MRTVLLGEPAAPVAEWLDRRRALAQDSFDEVWEGEYHVAPMAHSRHGDVGAQLAAVLQGPARERGLWPFGPVNIGYPDNYRVPDHAILRTREAAVFLSSAAVVIEIVSPGDESYTKLPFYFDIGIEEVLIADPDRRRIECYRRGEAVFQRADGSDLLGLEETDLTAQIDWPD